ADPFQNGLEGCRRPRYLRAMSDQPTVPSLVTSSGRCETCPIRHQAVCSYASPEELAELEALKYYRDFDIGREIVGEGEATGFVGSVVTGVVALHKTLEDGRRQMVGLLFPSSFIGRPFRKCVNFEAVAVTPVRMCMFQRSKFEDFLCRSHALERRLLEMTLDEVDASREWMLLLGRKTAKERLASFLMILARRTSSLDKQPLHQGSRIELPVTREAMAEYLGLTIETVSRQMTALRKAGVIELVETRVVEISDLDAFYHAAGEDPGPFDWPQQAQSA
ncbi:MAG: helix-turn-helix domain-containing protein, partial [Pseudomonadota bacterium]